MVFKWFMGKANAEQFRTLARQVRAPRIRASALSSILFETAEGLGDFRPEVANISATGVGFFRSSAESWPEIGGWIRGKIRIASGGGEEAYEVSARVVHISEIVGCGFEPLPERLAADLYERFKTEVLATRLSEVRADILQQPERGRAHFFCSSGTDELYYVEDAGRLLHFNVSFEGIYLEGGADSKLRYGKLEAETAPGKATYKGSALVSAVTQLDIQTRQKLMRFIHNIEGASRTVLAEIVERLAKLGS